MGAEWGGSKGRREGEEEGEGGRHVISSSNGLFGGLPQMALYAITETRYCNSHR